MNTPASSPHRLRHALGSWWTLLLLACTSLVCLLAFYFPKTPSNLVSIQGHERNPHTLVNIDIFPGSGILLGMSYRQFQLHEYPATFYTDFSFTNYPSEPLDTPLDNDRSLLNIKVHSVSIFQPESRTWCRYSPAHPHGSGHLFAVGALTAILFLVLVIKKVFYP